MRLSNVQFTRTNYIHYLIKLVIYIYLVRNERDFVLILRKIVKNLYIFGKE